jgi:hypothetical protein
MQQTDPDQNVDALGPDPSGPVPDSGVAPQRRRSGLGWRLVMLTLLAALVMGYALVSTRTISLPDFLVAEVETRANRQLQTTMPGLALSLDGLEFGLKDGHTPVLTADGVSLIAPSGQTALTLPEASVELDGSALLTARIAVTAARISGAHLTLERLADGRLNLRSLAASPETPKVATDAALQIDDLGRLFDELDRLMAENAGNRLPDTVVIEAASADFRDEISGRILAIGDGQITLRRQENGIALSVGATLQSDQQAGLAQLTLTGQHDRAARQISLSGQVAGLTARALAAHVPAVGWLRAVEGDVALNYHLVLDEKGPAEAEAELGIGNGQIQPRPEATPAGFDQALLRLVYDRGQGRIQIPVFSLDAPRLSMLGNGQILMVDGAGAVLTDPFRALPAAFLVQINLDQVQIAEDGIWEKPVVFENALIEARLLPDPLTLEIGQLRLARGASIVTGAGRIGTGRAGWTASFDLALDQINTNEVVALWPLDFLPLTRMWLVKNVIKGMLSNLNFALRMDQGTPGRGGLTFVFQDLGLTYMPGMPPIEAARGQATLDGPSLTFLLSEGYATPPQGARVALAGSSFSILDLAIFPAPAELRLRAVTDLTGMLSLLDQKPFGFITKAKLPVDLGQGDAAIEARIGFPMKQKVEMQDLSLSVQGLITGFQSTQVIKTRNLSFPTLAIAVDNQGLTLSGQGDLDGVAMSTEFFQGFAPASKGRAEAKGQVTLSAASMEALAIGLPKGMVSGTGKGDYTLTLSPDAPPALALTSTLKGIGLSLPEFAWSKSRDAKAALSVKISLGPVPQIDKIDLTAPDLKASGRISLTGIGQGGGMKTARFDRVQVGRWLDAAIEMTGRGKGRSPDIRIVEGSLDLRHLKDSGGFRPSSGSGGRLSLELDELVVSDGIALTGFQGSFKTNGGLNGDFIAALNGKARVKGAVLSQKRGLAVQLTSADAGALLAASGIIKTAVGGALTLTLTPLGTPGHYLGRAEATGIRLRHSSGLSELLNALSIVGLLESLNGAGILFNQAEADFVLMPGAVDLKAGSAIGGSMGLSMSGLYQSSTGRLDMQGTLSPFYALNSIGAALTRKGEGLFGFNYRLTGSASSPQVQVNPLSILTPGAFREIFRQSPPRNPDGN